MGGVNPLANSGGVGAGAGGSAANGGALQTATNNDNNLLMNDQVSNLNSQTQNSIQLNDAQTAQNEANAWEQYAVGVEGQMDSLDNQMVQNLSKS